MVDETTVPKAYQLDRQIGFLLRRANQRHVGLFSQNIPDLTPTQFAALAKLCALGRVSQNALGRATSMDAATIKGVVDRLRKRGYVVANPDPNDQRRIDLSPSPEGQAAYDRLVPAATQATDDTLAPLSDAERTQIIRLLDKLT